MSTELCHNLFLSHTQFLLLPPDLECSPPHLSTPHCTFSSFSASYLSIPPSHPFSWSKPNGYSNFPVVELYSYFLLRPTRFLKRPTWFSLDIWKLKTKGFKVRFCNGSLISMVVTHCEVQEGRALVTEVQRGSGAPRAVSLLFSTHVLHIHVLAEPLTVSGDENTPERTGQILKPLPSLPPIHMDREGASFIFVVL